MTEATSGTDGAPGATRHVDPVVAAREAEVERQREQLADTVGALQERLDVKTRMQARVRTARARLTGSRAGTRLGLAAGAAAVGVAALVWWRSTR